MTPGRGRRVIATPTLSDAGGGVAAVARLAWRTCEEMWGSDARLVTLPLAGDAGLSSSAKLSFGSRLAVSQLTGRTRWLLFAHLGPARVQRAVPTAVQRPYGVILYGVEAWGALSAGDRRLLAAARLRLAVSAHTARRVEHVHPDIGPVLPCPLSLAPDDPVVESASPTLPADARAPIVLMVGRLHAAEAYKGHAEVIAAWPAVLARHPAARLVVVGGGSDLPRLRDEARNSGAGDSIEFTGFVSREALRDWYARAALFALPSRGEGFGLVYLEAMTHELPCIGSLDDAAGDVIVDGETGYLVPGGDAGVIADRMIRLLGDAALRQRLGRAGARRAGSTFSFAAFRARFLALLETHLEHAA